MSNLASRQRVLMVCTRDIPDRAESGRERTMAFIRRSLGAQGEVQSFRLRSLLEQRSPGRALAIIVAFLGGVLAGRPLPLQALLFHDRRRAEDLREAVSRERPDAVYFDGVRSGVLAIALRSRFPRLRIVCDFDDLMSRRMEVLAATRQPISMGYLKKLVPAWVQQHVLDGIVARAIQAYEWRALRSLERRICRACDEVVLVSSVDGAHLRDQAAGAPVTVIPPYMAEPRATPPLRAVERFVFIGADSLLQNRQAIEFLVELWARVRPATPLHVFGKQAGRYADAPGVVFRGFVADVAEAYAPGGLLLAPSFLSGGVKTKVLEAMSYGCIPLGTRITFEGIEADFAGLTGDAARIEDWVRDPSPHLLRWSSAGKAAIAQAARHHAEARLAARWCAVVWPAGA